MFFQLMLYDFISHLTFKRLVKLAIGLICLGYYTAYNLIERRHPGIHKAQLMTMYNKYIALLHPYEPFLISACIAVIILFIFYMVLYAYRNTRKKTNDIPQVQKTPDTEDSKDKELFFLKAQLQMIQQRIETIEKG